MNYWDFIKIKKLLHSEGNNQQNKRQDTEKEKTFADVFSHSVGYFLVLLIVSFAMQKLFILMKSQKLIFALVSLASEDISRKKLL